MKILIKDLLKKLIEISKKSAEISQLCRAYNDDMFNMLIQEKLDDSKNPRFNQDFKTFADVLIQVMAKYCLELEFPGLSKRVYGEEVDHFENRLGESITVKIGSDVDQTIEMLVKILNGNLMTAKSLVQIIYSSDINNSDNLSQLSNELHIDQNEIAIWIDPIDSTSEYINGKCHRYTDSSSNGLQCVTCLFGVFDIKSGIPILGVLNQPFYKHQKIHEQISYTCRSIWGFNFNGVCGNNLPKSTNSTIKRQIILVGGKENEEIKTKLSKISETRYVSGAGYKLLCVVLGQADLLVTSSKTTFFWDTCAGHAILRSVGGGIIAFEGIDDLTDNDLDNLDNLQIRYHQKNDNYLSSNYNNSKGLIAYTDKNALSNIIKFLTT